MKQSPNKCQCHQQGPLMGEQKIQQLSKQVTSRGVPDVGGGQCFLGSKIKVVLAVG